MTFWNWLKQRSERRRNREARADKARHAYALGRTHNVIYGRKIRVFSSVDDAWLRAHYERGFLHAGMGFVSPPRDGEDDCGMFALTVILCATALCVTLLAAYFIPDIVSWLRTF